MPIAVQLDGFVKILLGSEDFGQWGIPGNEARGSYPLDAPVNFKCTSRSEGQNPVEPQDEVIKRVMSLITAKRIISRWRAAFGVLYIKGSCEFL